MRAHRARGTGQTVDTSHSVVTSSTSPAAVYVALSRGRDANTAHVATQSGALDPAQGREHEKLHRDPIAVLAGVLADADQAVQHSALATAT